MSGFANTVPLRQLLSLPTSLSSIKAALDQNWVAAWNLCLPGCNFTFAAVHIVRAYQGCVYNPLLIDHVGQHYCPIYDIRP